MRHLDAQALVYQAIDGINRQLPAERRLPKAPETIIVGAGGALDSLGIITFVIELEESLAAQLGRPVQLLDETTLTAIDGPLRTVGSLVRFIEAMTPQ